MTNTELIALALIHASEQIASMRGESQLIVLHDLLASGQGFGSKLSQQGRARLCQSLMVMASPVNSELVGWQSEPLEVAA